MPNQGRSFLDRKGITLIAAIILIVFASIAILGIATFIIQRLSQEQTQQIRTKCIYLAQAGIHQAIYFFRFHRLTGTGYFTLGQVGIDTNNFFVLDGTAGDLLMVNTSASNLGPPDGPADLLYRQLSGLTMQNATNSKTITIDRMIVTWNNSRRLKSISIDGLVVWSDFIGKGSPADCDIDDFLLDQIPTIYNIDYLEFNGDMRDATISIQFDMTDGYYKSLTVYPPSPNYSFTVKSTGQTTNSNIYRTIEADYNVLAGGTIPRYHEIDIQMVAD